MPNWVKNRVRAKNRNDAEKLIAMLVRKSDGEMLTNFNGIVPMPEELQKSTAGWGGNPKQEKEDRRLEKKYGYKNWYDFAVCEWGTKWDNLKVDVEDGVIEFESAWTMPVMIYSKIAETVPIVVAFADEDIGVNYGIIEFDENGTRPIEVPGNRFQVANAIWRLTPGEIEDGEGEDYSTETQDAVDDIMEYPADEKKGE